MKTKILLMVVVLAGLIFSLSASAQIGCPPITTDPSCVVIPIQPTSFSYDREIPKFDPSLGQLLQVKLTSTSCGSVDVALDSEDLTSRDWQVVSRAGVFLLLPNGEEIFSSFGTPDDLLVTTAPDDEPGQKNPDYLGPDSYTELFEDCSADVEKTYDYLLNPAQIELFTGPGTLPVTVASRSSVSVFNANSNNVFYGSVSNVGADICVEYTYQPICLFCINGTKTNDCTGDPIPGWEICLSNSSGQIDCIETDANGDYSFCGLTPGNYQVTEETREGWVSMDATVKDVALVDDNVDGVDFLNAPLTCISGHKFNSKTNAGLSGWTIQLKDANGAMIRETTTGTGGFYQFCGLAPGRYTVCEVLKAQWKAVSPICIDVELVECDNSEDNDFFNEPSNLVCVCPFFIKNELYNANCNAIYEVDASKGILANDPPGSIVLNPESITIDPKYGTITVEEDGSFVYDPTGATALHTGVYVIFKYAANNGFCDSKYLGVAKIQVSCK